MSVDCLDLGLSFSTECVKKISLRLAQIFVRCKIKYFVHIRGTVTVRHVIQNFLVGIYH